ncbi:MAG: hypothetical protein PHT07_19155 [Paludibacter sp.]|nr:hypothetical protein [Paludibacter sp.]
MVSLKGNFLAPFLQEWNPVMLGANTNCWGTKLFKSWKQNGIQLYIQIEQM